MRVAFLLNAFPNLSETFILNQITGLINRGCEVDIYADCAANVSQVHPDVEQYRLCERTRYLPIPNNYARLLFARLGLLFAGLWKASQIMHSLNVLKLGWRVAPIKLLDRAISGMSRGHYDIIHCHFGPNGLRGMLLREHGIIHGKLVTTFYGYDVSCYLRQVGQHSYDRLFQQGDLFITISETMRRQLTELGCDETKIHIHHLGVDLAMFPSITRRPSVDGRLRIVTIGRLVPKKGIEYGIRAVAQLSRANCPLSYTIVGDGDLRAHVQQLIRDLDMDNVVNLVGWKQQPEIVNILSHSDILLTPSVTARDGDQEGTPVVIMEGMAMGLPVVSTLHSGIPEVVQDGISGCLVPERDVDAMVRALAHLIEHPQARAEMGRAGYEIIKARYDINTLNDHLVEIYQALLNAT